MLHIGKILYPTDFSETAGHALAHAVGLAQEFGAELHMLHARVLHADDPGNPSHTFPELESLDVAVQERAEEELGATAKQHVAPEVKVKRVQVRGLAVAEVILDYVDDQEIDLIVMGTHGRRGLRRLLLGSVAQEIVRRAPCPVLTVSMRSEVEARVSRLVVPIDFSEHSKLALRYAAEIARMHRTPLSLLHVVEPPVYPDFYGPLLASGDVISEKLGEQALKRLKGLAAELPDGVKRDVHIRKGNSASQIVTFAEERGADLIVIASHGLTGMEHLMLGSVSERVVREAHCPVFTVKAFGKKLAH